MIRDFTQDAHVILRKTVRSFLVGLPAYVFAVLSFVAAFYAMAILYSDQPFGYVSSSVDFTVFFAVIGIAPYALGIVILNAVRGVER